jgi:hypothetical protein
MVVDTWCSNRPMSPYLAIRFTITPQSGRWPWLLQSGPLAHGRLYEREAQLLDAIWYGTSDVHRSQYRDDKYGEGCHSTDKMLRVRGCWQGWILASGNSRRRREERAFVVSSEVTRRIKLPSVNIRQVLDSGTLTSAWENAGGRR